MSSCSVAAGSGWAASAAFSAVRRARVASPNHTVRDLTTPVTPETETNEEIAAKVPANEWPIMLKNTSLSLGKGVFRVKTKEKLFEILDEYRASTELQAAIKATNDGITAWFSDEDQKNLQERLGGFVPPFLFEHCVNLDDGWVEYCYEGCINEQGKLTHYGFTEELYDSEHAGIAYVTPPMTYKRPPSTAADAPKRGDGIAAIASQESVAGSYRSTELRTWFPSLPPTTYKRPASTAATGIMRRVVIGATACHASPIGS